MSKLSVTLATYNEEANLERCLNSIADIADEIIVVDGTSNDKTVQIAKKFKAKVKIVPNQTNFHINKQMANDIASNKWILQLDADEVVSKELAKEIKHITSLSQEELNEWQINPNKKDLFLAQQQQLEARDGRVGDKQGDLVAFFVPRKNYFLGTWLMHAGVYPDGVIRLFQNNKAKLPCKSVHEQYDVSGRVSWTNNDLLHFDSPTFQRYLERNNRYSSLFATELEEQKEDLNIPTALRYLFLKPLRIFISLYIRHSGYKDGFAGLVFSFYSGLTWANAYVKYWQKAHN